MTDCIEHNSIQTETIDPKIVRDALLRLRQIAANLPPVDATVVVRDIREAASRTTWCP